MKKNLSPSKKLEIIAIQLAKPIDFGRQPFQSFKSIFQLRDFLAHGRTEFLTDESVQFLSDGQKPELPKAKWQKEITVKNVQQYFDDTKEMIEFLHSASGLDLNPLFVPETAGWKITLIEDKKNN